MKVRALIDCSGLGYDLKKGNTADLKKKLADKLIRFNYVKEVKEEVVEVKEKKNKETKVK